MIVLVSDCLILNCQVTKIIALNKVLIFHSTSATSDLHCKTYYATKMATKVPKNETNTQCVINVATEGITTVEDGSLLSEALVPTLDTVIGLVIHNYSGWLEYK